jgi:23S rRNA (uracil1939-C5)-methyltransferase
MRKTTASDSFEITIEKLIYGGSGFARHNGKVIFVPFSVPGDRLLVHSVEEKKTYIRAAIDRIVEPGSGRIDPQCPHFGRCGGCQWQQLEYARQVDAKRQILQELFHHKFPQTQAIPIIMRACLQPFGYRSRTRMQLRGSGSTASVGFFQSESHIVKDVEYCPLFRPSLNEALNSLRQFKIKVDTDNSPQEMDMACSEEEGTWATARVGSDINDGVSTLFGTGKREDVVLRRKVGEFIYAVTASTFFQANDFMITELTAQVRKSAETAGSESALDLFSGVGLFSLPLAQQFKKVVAVENSQPSCRFCKSNASAAGLKNIQTVCMDVVSWLESEASSGSPNFELIVLDPPRTGAGPAIMDRLREWAPEKILYVSCDPQTLVRDLARISPHDYRIDSVEGLDMFPQTYHFETVVGLTKL